jgi:DNA-binding transcriptional ArsR family regulator
MSEDTKACGLSVDSQYADLAAEVFTLRDAEKSVSELAEEIGKSPTVISQHLAKLRWGRIVAPRREGNRAIYSLIDEHARELVAHAVFQAQHVVSDAPEHHRAADGSLAVNGRATAPGT